MIRLSKDFDINDAHKFIRLANNIRNVWGLVDARDHWEYFYRKGLKEGRKK